MSPNWKKHGAAACALAVCTSIVSYSAFGGGTDTPIDVEVIPAEEAEDIRTNTALTVELQAKRKQFPRQAGEVLRGVHPKSHGCVNATFTVIGDIGREYQIGLFGKPATYAARVRFSNASVLKLGDLEGGNGSRGMAIKVLGVVGPLLLSDGGSRNQDFLMVNTPEFAFANVRDYLRLSRVLVAHPLGADPGPYFIPLSLMQAGLLE